MPLKYVFHTNFITRDKKAIVERVLKGTQVELIELEFNGKTQPFSYAMKEAMEDKEGCEIWCSIGKKISTIHKQNINSNIRIEKVDDDVLEGKIRAFNKLSVEIDSPNKIITEIDYREIYDVLEWFTENI